VSDVDQLYEADLGDFVSLRNELARRLRSEGDVEAAAEVAALRKPTVPVWTANQLARRNRRDVDLLLDASHRMRAAVAETDPQKARAGLEQARAAEQRAIRSLRTAAEELLESRGLGASLAMVDRVATTLQNAARSDEARELLARGRLTEEVAPAGFGLVENLPATPPQRASRRRGSAAAGARELKDARNALGEAKERKQGADRAVREATRRADQAARALNEADGKLREAQAEADAAAAQVDKAQAVLDRLQKRR
jgi:hypothetical protein